MQIQSIHALSGMVISMSSPDFTRAEHHCLTFEYEVTATQGMPELEVHVRRTDYMLSGEKIWSSEYHTSQNINANVTIWAVKNSKDAPYVFDFVGILAEPGMTSIRIADIRFSSDPCTFETNLTTANISGNNFFAQFLYKYQCTYQTQCQSWKYFIRKVRLMYLPSHGT